MKKLISFALLFCLLLASCVTVAESSQTEPFTLYPAYLQVPLGQHVTLDADTAPADKKLVWSSSDTSVATVDGNGRITPVAEGETVITASVADDPTISSTCGILVTAEGNILLWEYLPEPLDMDAIIAYWDAADYSAADVEQSENTLSIPWPELWPDNLLKLEGTVKFSFGEALDSPTGLMVTLTVEGLDVVKAYVRELVSWGLKANEMPVGDYYVMLAGKGYQIIVNYTDSSKECIVLLKK